MTAPVTGITGSGRGRKKSSEVMDYALLNYSFHSKTAKRLEHKQKSQKNNLFSFPEYLHVPAEDMRSPISTLPYLGIICHERKRVKGGRGYARHYIAEGMDTRVGEDHKGGG